LGQAFAFENIRANDEKREWERPDHVAPRAECMAAGAVVEHPASGRSD
jgi:hypothetical protein